MLKEENKVFNNLLGAKGKGLDVALSLGDWKDAESYIKKGRDFIIEEVKNSGLRGRGGAGFSTGMKWSFIAKDDNKEHYLVINGDEGEPGTCKDREILRNEPHKLLEGIFYASYAVSANVCYIYVRGEFYNEAVALQNAIDEAYKKGLIGKNACNSGHDIDVYLHLGSGAYVCGEESALIESLEGKKGQPRLKPPFPAVFGLYGKPTVVNNVETIATVPAILKRGASWYSSLGVEGSAGTKLFSISGCVNNPITFEEELGVPLKTMIEEYAGGVIGGWENLQAVIPGGSSVPMLPANICKNVKMDYQSLQDAGSALGTGAIIVMDKSVDVIKAISILSDFYHHESCGQCTPCREGTGWMKQIMERMVKGDLTSKEVDELYNLTKKVEGRTICALGDAAAWPIQGLIKSFRSVIENRIMQNSKNG